MRVCVTGTPGTGKTTAVGRVGTDLEVIALNDLVHDAGLIAGTDEERNSAIADIDAVAARLSGRDGVLVESHLAHHLEADRVVVLRCHPEALTRRLGGRGAPEREAAENAEAEALDVILSEAVERHGLDRVYEIDTTGRDPEAVAGDIEAVLDGDRDPTAGAVDFTGYL
ncbi:adenylate kinase family protein [Natronomonas sp.]|uniref:adenylate kinase family protein n=1 Tax=Natronomonas sp. TaxID=2184060 RepID=UPI00260596D9|nr:AAA family ATPase [Natronomonas sp.]